MTRSRRAGWILDVAAAAAAATVVIGGLGTIHRPAIGHVVAAGTVVVALSSLVGPIARSPAIGVGPWQLATVAIGLTGARSAHVAVGGLALAALVPVAATIALPRIYTFAFTAVAAGVSGIVVAERVLLRDPFRERRCAPFCGDNPMLLHRAPEVLLVSESVLGVTAVALGDRGVGRQWAESPGWGPTDGRV